MNLIVPIFNVVPLNLNVIPELRVPLELLLADLALVGDAVAEQTVQVLQLDVVLK